MKHKSLIFFTIMAMALFISSVVGRASEPMSEEEIKIYKKYEGNWGGGAWTAIESRHRFKEASVEFQIGEIDSANRKAKVLYLWGESAKGQAAGKRSYMADCVDGKLIFETSKYRFELWMKGNDELFAQRKGNNPLEVILKRIK